MPDLEQLQWEARINDELGRPSPAFLRQWRTLTGAVEGLQEDLSLLSDTSKAVYAATLTAAKALFAAGDEVATGQAIVVAGRTSVDDGYGGVFTYDAADTTSTFALDALGFVDNQGRRFNRLPVTAAEGDFTPPGTGGQERTVQLKLADQISTADYDTLAHALTAAGVTQEISVLANTQDEDTIWSGRDHKAAVTPYLVNSVTWSGAALNAGMDVAGRILVVCEFTNNKIAFCHLDNGRKPVMWRRMPCGVGPRWVKIVGQFMIVACYGDSKLEIYDISNSGGPTLVGSAISCGAGPKQFDIDGKYLYLACADADKIEKWMLVGFGPGETPTLLKITDVTVSNEPLCVKSNGAGVLMSVGINGNLQIISAVSMSVLSTTAVSGATELAFGTWISRTTVLATEKRGNLYTFDITDVSTPINVGSIAISTQPEMVLALGRRAYVASLTDSPTVAKIDAIDLASAQAPVKYLSPSTTISGAGFLAYFREGSGQTYLYVSGHFTPWNIDVFEIPDSGDEFKLTLPTNHVPVSYFLQDGITAPSAIVGVAQMYIDASSGDLKIIFGDGTVKTIVVDT